MILYIIYFRGVYHTMAKDTEGGAYIYIYTHMCIYIYNNEG